MPSLATRMYGVVYCTPLAILLHCPTMVPFADTAEYFDKYAPLIRLLRADDDYEWLLKAGYKKRIVEHFWKVNRSALAEYADELEADFQALYDSALHAAIGDEQLAMGLVKLRTALRKILRQIRYRLIIERISPPTGITGKKIRHATIRTTKIGDVSVAQLISAMDIVRLQIGASRVIS